ncbi:hypothetical protein D3C71_2143020 [compost metagenome]
MQGETTVKHVNPAFLRHQTLDLTGEDLHAATVADKNHDFVLQAQRCVEQLGQGAVIHPVGQIVADGLEGLLTRQLIAT